MPFNKNKTVIHVQLDDGLLRQLDGWARKFGSKRPSAAEAILRQFLEAIEGVKQSPSVVPSENPAAGHQASYHEKPNVTARKEKKPPPGKAVGE